MITRLEVFSSQPDAPELPLGGFMPNDDPVQIRNIDGLGPVKADLTSTPFATGRGELYQGGITGKRNIVLTLGLNPNWANQTVAELRQRLYRYLLPEEWCKLRFYSQELPPVDIEGIVESFEPNIFSEDPEIQISIICHKPDFVDVDATLFDGVVDDGTLELEFDYTGTISTGFELRVDRSIDNPAYTGGFKITHTALGQPQVFEITPVTVDINKYFKMSSVRSRKRVQTVDYLDGHLTNLLSAVTGPSVWPEVKPGKNIFAIQAAEFGQLWKLAYYNRYGGL